MSAVTLQAIEAKQTELSELIAKFKADANKPNTFIFSEATIELQPGERYAGAVLDESGHLSHHLVLMAARPTNDLNWQDANDWAKAVGGRLPNRQEQALLFANCKSHLKPVWHWSSQAHETEASYAWGCGFDYGDQDGIHKSYEGSPVAVRSV